MSDAGALWMLGGLLLLAVCIVLVVWAVSTSRRGNAPPASSHGSLPLEILRERLARGEISEQEFEQAKKALGL